MIGTEKLNRLKMYPAIITFECEDWLDEIISGKKTFEGQSWNGKWTNIFPGNILVFGNGGKMILTRVTSIAYYQNFESMFLQLGQKLLPGHIGKVEDYYSRYYSNEVMSSGAIGIGINFIGMKRSDELNFNIPNYTESY